VIPARLLPLARDVITAYESCAFDIDEKLDVWVDALLEAGVIAESPVCHRKLFVANAACRSCGNLSPGSAGSCHAWMMSGQGSVRTQKALAEKDRARLRAEAEKHAWGAFGEMTPTEERRERARLAFERVREAARLQGRM
jgi:hypothetical protein